MHHGRRRVLRYLAATLALGAAHCREKPRADAGSKSGAPERIVSLSPSTTEILFALGAGDRVVGRTRYCDHPPEARAVPIVGGFVDANLETIAQSKTDLVVGARGPGGQAIADKLTAIGIASFFPKTDSIADIEAAIADIAEKIGLPDRGRAIVAAMRAKREAIAAAVAGAPRVRTLFVFGLDPIGVAGPGSFSNEMLELAGGENVMKGGGPFPVVNAETLVALDPELILDASVTGRDLDASAVDRTAPGWRDLRATSRGKIVPILDLAVIRPGPRTADGIATLARILHPEVKLP